MLYHSNFCIADDSEDEKDDHKNVRQQRQAASKAASKQREMLLEDVGSEEEPEDDDETPFQESMYSYPLFFSHLSRQSLLQPSVDLSCVAEGDLELLTDWPVLPLPVLWRSEALTQGFVHGQVLSRLSFISNSSPYLQL